MSPPPLPTPLDRPTAGRSTKVTHSEKCPLHGTALDGTTGENIVKGDQDVPGPKMEQTPDYLAFLSATLVVKWIGGEEAIFQLFRGQSCVRT